VMRHGCDSWFQSGARARACFAANLGFQSWGRAAGGIGRGDLCGGLWEYMAGLSSNRSRTRILSSNRTWKGKLFFYGKNRVGCFSFPSVPRGEAQYARNL
jgi:hypothetical protein